MTCVSFHTNPLSARPGVCMYVCVCMFMFMFMYFMSVRANTVFSGHISQTKDNVRQKHTQKHTYSVCAAFYTASRRRAILNFFTLDALVASQGRLFHSEAAR